MVIPKLLLILLTNLLIIFKKNKFRMKEKKCLAISRYYEDLPRGEKDDFIRDVATAIDKSTSTVWNKLKGNSFSSIEIPIVEELINKRR